MSYESHRFLLMTSDPLHIGTGGYRLGRVDLAIAREPGTNLPKIPGTSLNGAARSYAAFRYNKLDCAGKGGATGEKHCARATCPVCYTFGYARGEQGGYQGIVSLFDAQLLLFPTHSMAGPVWVSTPARLEEAGFLVTNAVPTDDAAAITLSNWDKPLNLGWLLLDTRGAANIEPPPGDGQSQSLDWDLIKEWRAVRERIVLVTEKLFAPIVNSNLEVRTSVSINPDTGAAEEGALFTYEAIPRATWLWCDVIVDDYRQGAQKPWPVGKKARREEIMRNGQKQIVWHDNGGEDLGETWQRPLDVVKSGLKLAEHLGIGGMGTRGFGRVRTVQAWRIDHER